MVWRYGDEESRTVALTCALLFVQDKHAPRYIQIYTGEHD